jgi:hypothetical protein
MSGGDTAFLFYPLPACFFGAVREIEHLMLREIQDSAGKHYNCIFRYKPDQSENRDRPSCVVQRI